MGEVTPPAILNPDHETSEFSSGNETLDSWLDKLALQAGYIHFFGGDYAKASGPSDDADFVYTS